MQSADAKYGSFSLQQIIVRLGDHGVKQVSSRDFDVRGQVRQETMSLFSCCI